MKAYLSATFLSAGLVLASLGLTTPVSYAVPAHSGAAPSQKAPPATTNLRFVPVQTTPDWKAAGLSLKRAEITPGVWNYILESSHSGQQAMFAVPKRGQPVMLSRNWSSTSKTGATAEQKGVMANYKCPNGCQIHRQKVPHDTTIVVITGQKDKVVTIFGVGPEGKVTPLIRH